MFNKCCALWKDPFVIVIDEESHDVMAACFLSVFYPKPSGLTLTWSELAISVQNSINIQYVADKILFKIAILKQMS